MLGEAGGGINTFIKRSGQKQAKSDTHGRSEKNLGEINSYTKNVATGTSKLCEYTGW